MAQTIDGTLAAAQDGIDRHPIVEVASDLFVNSIPLVGAPLSSGAGTETAPSAITLGDGSLALAYIADASTVVFSVTNPARTEFSSVSISAVAERVALASFGNGNIGMLLQGTGGITYMTLSPAGAVLASGTIDGNVNYHGVSVAWNPSSGLWIAVTIWSDLDPADPWWELDYFTSPDFINWSGYTYVALPGFLDTNPKQDPFIFVDADGQVSVLLSYADEFMFTEGTPLTQRANIYQFKSDDGVSWSSAGKVTNYPDYTAGAYGSAALWKGGGSFMFAYHEQRTALHMNHDTLGWYGNPNTGRIDDVDGVFFDPVGRKLYLTNIMLNGAIEGLIVVDVDTWTIDDAISPSSNPTFNSMWWTVGEVNLANGRVKGAKTRIPIIRTDATGGHACHIAVYDSASKTIREYHFEDLLAYEITANITGRPTFLLGYGEILTDLDLTHAFVDEGNNRIYLLWMKNYVSGSAISVGYIDLTEVGPAFTYTTLFTNSNAAAPIEEQILSLSMGYGDFRVYPNEDLIVISGGHGSSFQGFTRTYSLSGAALITHYDNATNAGYPYRGLTSCALVDGHLYGGFSYESQFGEQDKRGLADILLGSGAVVCIRPSGAAHDDYLLRVVAANAAGSEIYITTGGYGFYCYTIATGVWEQFVNENYPGLFPDENSQAASELQYDELTQQIYIGKNDGAWRGLISFNRNGLMKQIKYLMATKGGGGTWSYGAASSLALGWKDSQVTLAGDPLVGTYVFWAQSHSPTSIVWGQDAAGFDLTDYLAAGSSVEIKRSIDGSPHKLSFTVANGHLFDPNNLQSLWSGILQKYRKITVRFGERVSGVDYWMTAGTFIVTGSKMSYERGTYPTLAVEAEDMRTWWADSQIVATDHYEDTPENILADIMETFGGLDAGDIAVSAFADSYEVWFQWLDTSIKKIVDTLCSRFGVFPTITADNRFITRPISNANAVDHTYPDTVFLVSYSPDDSFSDFTNRVLVTGESRTFLEVLYQEESVGQLFGTAGWWVQKKTYDVWYSDDHTRRCRYPRLEVLESVTTMTFIGGGGGESITFIDPEEHYCTVTVEIPPGALATAIAGIIAVVAVGIACGTTQVVSGYCFIGFSLALGVCLYAISVIGNFQYQIYAQPFGKQRLGVQGAADDLELQHLLNRVVEKKIDDPLCITAAQCHYVADHELMIAMLQRRRLTFEKVAHLQDEEGDTIVIAHPYTKAAMTIFITDLTRKFHVPSEQGGSGGFIDSIAGWVL